NVSVGKGGATVPAALFGVSPNSWCGRFHSPFGAPRASPAGPPSGRRRERSRRPRSPYSSASFHLHAGRRSLCAPRSSRHAVHHQYAAGFFAGFAFASLFQSKRSEINALELGGWADDFRQTETQLLRHERLETVAIAIGGVEIVVIRPGERPVVAALCSADDCFLRRPCEACDPWAGWIRSRTGQRCRRGIDGFHQGMEKIFPQRRVVICRRAQRLPIA